jgi:hypothetical protein
MHLQYGIPRNMIVVLLVTIIFLLPSIGGCRNNNDSETDNSMSSDIAYALNDIALDLYEISNSLNEGTTTEEDRQEVERLNGDLAEIEAQIAALDNTEVISDEIIVYMIEKETLRASANSILSYFNFRDNQVQAEYILMSLMNSSLDYSNDAFIWLDYIFGRESSPYNREQLIGILLVKYFRSAMDNCLLSYYEIDSSLFDLNKQELQGLLASYGANMARIIEEVKSLEIEEEWVPVRDELFNTLTEMDKQNSFLIDSEWPIKDAAALDKMLEEYIANIDKMYEAISPLLPQVE